jgi:CheY-like chemotaxis protein
MRNPLQGIKGVLDILKNHQIPAERFDYLLDNAIRTTNHLNDMVNEVLSLKQLRSGMFSDSPVPHNIRDIVDTTIFIYKEQAHQKGLKFNVNYDEDLPEQLFIPNKSLKIVLSNLTSNAVKYTAQGEINIDISFTQGMLTLSVQDTGIGIPKTLTDKIFDEYYQVDQRLTKDFQGTGIGLSIVKPLISRLEGSITAHSTLNEGSTFTVTFPCKLVLQSKSSLASSAVKQHHKLPNLAGTSILVVEDNMINRAILKEQLEACGASITEAENGAEALDLIKINHFDVVLSDIAMPILDGVGLVKAVRQFESQLIMVAISGNTLHNEITAYYDAGFNYVLSKPYNTEKLYDIILKVRKRQLIKS